MTGRTQLLVMFLPSFLAGIHSSTGDANGGFVLGALAIAIGYAFYLDRADTAKDDRTGLLGAVMVGGGIGLAGMTIGLGLGKFVDYVQTF